MGLYLLIPLSVVIVFIIGVIFWWSVRSGQFDDMEGPAYRMLIDDQDRVRKPGGNPLPDAENNRPDGAIDGDESAKPNASDEPATGKAKPDAPSEPSNGK